MVGIPPDPDHLNSINHRFLKKIFLTLKTGHENVSSKLELIDSGLNASKENYIIFPLLQVGSGSRSDEKYRIRMGKNHRILNLLTVLTVLKNTFGNPDLHVPQARSRQVFLDFGFLPLEH